MRQLERQQYSFIEAEIQYLRELAVVNRIADTLSLRRSMSQILTETAFEASRIGQTPQTWVITPTIDLAIAQAFTPDGGVHDFTRLPIEARDLFDRLVRERPSIPLLAPRYKPDGREGLFMGLKIATAKHLVGGLVLYFDDPSAATSGHQTRILQTMLEQTAIACENSKLHQAMSEMIVDVVASMALAIESRDPYTGGHTVRVTGYSVMLAEAMGVDARSLMLLRLGGLLHDIGKVAVPDAILRKPAKLSVEEYEMMKSHATVGHAIVSSIPQMACTCDIIRHHHERWDGKGYPDGLAGDRIPLLARIVAIADAFDAMTSDRPYRTGMPLDAALSEIEKCAGTQFDPKLAALFVDVPVGHFPEAVAELDQWRHAEQKSDAIELIELLELDMPRVG